jgi:hypothetical protein
MRDLRRPALPQQDSDDVKTVSVPQSAEASPPAFRHPGERPELLPAESLSRVSAGERGPGLDLDKGHQLRAPDNEVDVVTADPEAVRLDLPSPGGQPGERELLPTEAAEVAGIGPIGNGNEGAGRHEGKFAPGSGAGGTGMDCRVAGYCRYPRGMVSPCYRQAPSIAGSPSQKLMLPSTSNSPGFRLCQIPAQKVSVGLRT